MNFILICIMYLLYYCKKVAKSFLLNIKSIFYYLPKFLIVYFKFKKQSDKRFDISLKNLHPCLQDATTYTPFDAHYIYHPAWAARVIKEINPVKHIDISSTLYFSSILSAFVPVDFYDYRPAKLNLHNFTSASADLVNLHFQNESIDCISCMHTIEHIGLGRYGDPLDIKGDIKAINELQRVVKKDGHIIFVTPVGKPKIAFNAHRIFSYEQIMEYFSFCSLVEFSLVTDDGNFTTNANPIDVALQQYGCGCFVFKKN